MPIFQYEAISSKGKSVKGTIDADTARDAREKLRRREIRVTTMNRIEASRRAKADKKSGFQLERKISTRNLAILTRQLSTLLGSGIHLAEGLTALIDQVQERRTQMVLRDVREKVVSGGNLADAMSYHPMIFSDLYVNMVRAGEASGNLDEVLTRLADFLQKQASLRGKISAALTYPAIMILVGVGVVVFLMSYVVPKITTILEKRKQALPAPTEILMFISSVFENYWWIMLVALLIVMVNLRLFLATEKGRHAFDVFLLRVPFIGVLFKKQAISRFTITLSALLKSGLPALEALKIVSKVVNNTVLTKVIERVAERIIEGTDIATPMRQSKIFPPMVAYMIAVGEQTGQLEDILDRIAETYDEEIDLAVQRMTSAIEPAIIVFLAVVVGFIVMAVLLPLLQFNKV